MSDTNEPLILDLLEWLSKEPRTYREVMEAWRTSCPRLPLWEDAVDRGLVDRAARSGPEQEVYVTPRGRQLLREMRPAPAGDVALP